MKRYIHIKYMFSLDRNDTLQILFYISMKTSLQRLENDHHDRNLKINSTEQFDSRRGQMLKMQNVHFKGPHFACD